MLESPRDNTDILQTYVNPIPITATAYRNPHGQSTTKTQLANLCQSLANQCSLETVTLMALLIFSSVSVRVVRFAKDGLLAGGYQADISDQCLLVICFKRCMLSSETAMGSFVIIPVA